MKFQELDEYDKFRVYWWYRLKFIYLKVIHGQEGYNIASFEEFKVHKYGGHNWGEGDRILDLFANEIFNK